MGQPRPFFVFWSFQTNSAIFTTYQYPSVHPVYGAEIRTHNLTNMSRPLTAPWF